MAFTLANIFKPRPPQQPITPAAVPATQPNAVPTPPQAIAPIQPQASIPPASPAPAQPSTPTPPPAAAQPSVPAKPAPSAAEKKGHEGEKALNAWFKQHKLAYVGICQNKNSFATLFHGMAKRPDFLLLLPSLGMIAIDAKNYTPSRGELTLSLEEELKKALTFERLFRLPLWYAYCDKGNMGQNWYWISALKALEVGEVRDGSNGQFLAIKMEHFETIANPKDLAKLYTHTLPSLEKVAAAV